MTRSKESDLTVADTIKDALSSAGLELSDQQAEDGRHMLLVRGDTFPLNDVFLAIGAEWNGQLEAWTVEPTAPLDELARAAKIRHDRRSHSGLSESPFATDQAVGLDPLFVRLLEAGPDAINEEELLELFLLFGGYPRQAATTSVRLIAIFGSLGAVLAAEPARLKTVPRVDERMAALLKAIHVAMQRVLREPIRQNPVIGSWAALLDYLRLVLTHETVEQLRLLFLDRKNVLIRDEVQQRGTVDHTPLYPREIVKRALELGASAIIMVHNHPSGDPTPSRADIDMTKQVVQALGSVGITVHDHVIIGKNRHTSLKGQRMI